MPFWGSYEPPYNFHNDESLHDPTPPPAKFNVLRDTRPAARIALTKALDKSKLPHVVKEVLPDLDVNDYVSKEATKAMVSLLWGSMLHPPLSYRGPQYQYRSVDGSNNNIMYPNLGKAGTPYAKTVQGTRAFHGARPDPGDLFDLLMARNEATESHVGLSSLILYMATIVIHDIFRTDDEDVNISKTSSYLDLAPLYGSTKDELDSVRKFSDGLLKPDTFAEERLLNQPPGVCIFIVMFNRFHNYVAQQLLEINENGKFALPPGYEEIKNIDTEEDRRKAMTKKGLDQKTFETALVKQDEDLFQTARLVTSGMYAQIAIHDYLRCLMRMHEKNTAWTLDPRASYPGENDHRGLQRGEGNMVSAEFNLLYRFHSPLSERDRVWSEEALEGLLNLNERLTKKEDYIVDDDVDITKEQIRKGEKIHRSRYWEGDVPVWKWSQSVGNLKTLAKTRGVNKKALKFFPEGLDKVGVHGFQGNDGKDLRFRFERDPETGKFDDAQLAAEMIRTIEDPICHFGPQHIPKVFKQIEVLGMLYARRWEMASLNEFREFFGMTRHKKFEDINTDPKIQTALRDLYEDPDCVELYPGIYCEGDGKNLEPDEKMPNGAGSALWRGIFSDAVTLVRSDRFYTLDWNVQSLTAWGMNEVVSNPKVNKGSLFHKLFQRALPGFFTYNAIHMWQPFFTPTMNAVLAKEQGYINDLDLNGLEWSKRAADGWSVVGDSEYDGKSTNFKKDAGLKDGVKMSPTRMLRRKLVAKKERDLKWRGGEEATLAVNPITISTYNDIRDTILGDTASSIWMNPAVKDGHEIPEGPLKDLLTNKWNPWGDVLDKARQALRAQGHSDDNDKFLAYFTGLSKDITRREQRSMQYVPDYVPSKSKRKHGAMTNGTTGDDDDDKFRVKQIDIVKDYSIPVVTRFVADFLGFWDRVKTDMNDQARRREFTEDQIYQHIQNCQNIESYDSDPAKVWERRFAFRDSIRKLMQLAEYGIAKSESHWILESYRRVYGDYEETKYQPYVIEVRKIGVAFIQALEKAGYPRNKVAAIMLATALQAAHKVVLNFTEILAFFVDPTEPHNEADNNKTVLQLWKNLQGHAKNNTPADDQVIKKYVLEAGRLTNKLKLVRVYSPGKGKGPVSMPGVRPDKNGKPQTTTEVQPGDTVLVDLFTASHDAKVFEEPYKFKTDRKAAYLIFGNDVDSHDASKAPTLSKHLSLIAITGMLKHAVTLTQLRVAHDKLGRLKKVKTPNGLERYCDTQWRTLLPYPVTWNLRFDTVGDGVWEGGDNADQGHGMNQTWEPGLHIESGTSDEPIMSKDTLAKPVQRYSSTTPIKSPLNQITTVTTESVEA